MFDILFNSPVIDTDDEGLRRYTHERLKVFAKFTSANCQTYKLLAPRFADFADGPAYAGILFVRLASDENPVAKHLMNERAAPFFVSYCQGRQLECDRLETEAVVRAQLDHLRAYVPQTA